MLKNIRNSQKNLILIGIIIFLIIVEVIFKVLNLIGNVMYFIEMLFLIALFIDTTLTAFKLKAVKARNVVYSIILIFGTLLTVVLFIFLGVANALVGSLISKNGEINMGSINWAATILNIVYSGIYFYIYYRSNKRYRYDLNNYYKVSFSFLCFTLSFVYSLYNLIKLFSNVYWIYTIVIFITYYIAVFLIFLVCYIITHINIIAYNGVYEGKKSILLFAQLIFAKKVFYFLGIIFNVFVGLGYIATTPFILARYIGVFYFVLASLKLGDIIWWRINKNMEMKKSYKNQYFMMFYNSLILLSLYSASMVVNLQLLMEGSNKNLTIFSIFQTIILTIRFVILIIGFYFTRINVKKEPFFLTSNTLSFITFFLTLFTLLVTVLINSGVTLKDNSELYLFLISANTWIYIVFAVALAIRAILGIIFLRKKLDTLGQFN